jgi:hypothetical protein
MLRHVSVEISWHAVSNEQVDSITEDKFPRLVESKAVVFEFHSEAEIQFYVTL